MNTTTPGQNSNQRAFDVRGQILDDAKRCVNKDRNDTHGNPEDNFGAIARRWRAHIKNKYYVDLDLDPASVGIMMTDMKLARIEGNPTHVDSYVDAAGYVACTAGISLAKKPSELAGIESFQVPPPPTPSPTNHACGVFDRPDCSGEYSNLFTYMAQTRKPVNTDYMYDDICEFLGTTKNFVLCASAASLLYFRQLTIKGKDLPEAACVVLADHLDAICKRQGHTLYLY